MIKKINKNILSSIEGEVNKTVFPFYKTYSKPKIHKATASN